MTDCLLLTPLIGSVHNRRYSW